MDKETYLNEVISLIKDKSTKHKIRKELENHIDDRIGFYLDSGYDEETAERKAMERMGNAEDLAEEMKKLHNNKHWLILSVISLLIFVAGLVAADYMLTDFLIINIVDFSEVYGAPCVISVLTFLALVLSYIFARKSESTKLLRIIGYFGVCSPLVSIGALLPFGYQLVGVFTEFPAAIKLGEYYFDYNEIFVKYKEFLPDSAIGDFTSMAMTILVVLLSFFGVIVGVFAFISANEVGNEKPNKKTERILSRFSVFILIVALTAVIGTVTECVYDILLVNNIQNENENYMPLYYLELKKEWDLTPFSITTEEAIALAEENEMPEYVFADIAYSEIVVFSNDGGFIQLRDDNEDGVYETKRLYTSGCNCIGEDEIRSLEETSSLEELNEIMDYSYFEDYYETLKENKIEVSINTRNFEDEPIVINLEFDNNKTF